MIITKIAEKYISKQLETRWWKGRRRLKNELKVKTYKIMRAKIETSFPSLFPIKEEVRMLKTKNSLSCEPRFTAA